MFELTVASLAPRTFGKLVPFLTALEAVVSNQQDLLVHDPGFTSIGHTDLCVRRNGHTLDRFFLIEMKKIATDTNLPQVVGQFCSAIESSSISPFVWLLGFESGCVLFSVKLGDKFYIGQSSWFDVKALPLRLAQTLLMYAAEAAGVHLDELDRTKPPAPPAPSMGPPAPRTAGLLSGGSVVPDSVESLAASVSASSKEDSLEDRLAEVAVDIILSSSSLTLCIL